MPDHVIIDKTNDSSFASAVIRDLDDVSAALLRIETKGNSDMYILGTSSDYPVPNKLMIKNGSGEVELFAGSTSTLSAAFKTNGDMYLKGKIEYEWKTANLEFGGTSPTRVLRYCKDATDMVSIQGNFNRSTIAGSVFRLPADYAPGIAIQDSITVSNNIVYRLLIEIDGLVHLTQVGSAVTNSIDFNIHFRR